MIVGDAADPGLAALMDLDMLAASGCARERTLQEYDALPTAAGLQRTQSSRPVLRKASSKR